MKPLTLKVIALTLASAGSIFLASSANAGPVFLTGHDPDFHAQPGFGGGANLLAAGLKFVTGNTYNDGVATTKFLWVESSIPVPSGHLRGSNSLGVVGAALGLDFDIVDGAGFSAVDLTLYNAIAVASTFGGTLTAAELTAMIARKTDIENFINAGGGLFASAECYPCGANLAGSAANLFAYLPITVTSVGAAPPFSVTAFGTATFGLVDADMDDPTHNSFGATGGLNIVDTDRNGNATTLAGIVTIGPGGFNSTPEPGTLLLSVLALGALARMRYRTA